MAILTWPLFDHLHKELGSFAGYITQSKIWDRNVYARWYVVMSVLNSCRASMMSFAA